MCPRGCCPDYRSHLKSVALGVTSEQAMQVRQSDRDMHAYKRLVQSGVQPKQVGGSYELERGAASKFEVEKASIITDPVERRKMERAFITAEAFKPNTTPLDAA